MQQCTGFHAVTSRSLWRSALLLLCGPVTAVLAILAPQLAAKLLTPCALEAADYVLVKVSPLRLLLAPFAVKVITHACFAEQTGLIPITINVASAVASNTAWQVRRHET